MAQYEDLPEAAPEPKPDARVGRRRCPDEWFYIDTQGAEQGPFPLASIRAWFEAGYFPKEARILAKQGLHSEWEPMHGIEAITAPELPPEYALGPASVETERHQGQHQEQEKENEPEGDAGAAVQKGRKIVNGRRAGSAGSDASAVPATKDVHKLFDRATPAGAALYALYNAEENESRTVGNAFSRRNAAMIAKQRQRRAAAPAEPEPEKEIVPGSYEARRVRVPKVGRRKPQRGYSYGPGRPSKKPADQIISELVKEREQIISSNQLEAQRVASKTVDREAEKRRLARANELHGTDVKSLEKEVKMDRRREKAKSLAEVIEDEFNQVMSEIEERHAFLAQMRELGKAASYEATIKQEISERVARLKVIDRQRSQAAAAK
jgi:hypothetical protein